MDVVVIDQVAGSLGVAHVDPCAAVLTVFVEQLIHVAILLEDIKQAVSVSFIKQV